MRTVLLAVVVLVAVAAVAGRATGAGRALAQPETTPTPGTPVVDPEPGASPTPGTPVIDPEPQPRPVWLPWLARRNRPEEPPPVVPDSEGWIAGLTATGRAACAPATHVLLAEREGTRNNRALAVLTRASQDAPNLDLLVGDYVAVTGQQAVAAPDCRTITSRLIAVTAARRVPRPPGW